MTSCHYGTYFTVHLYTVSSHPTQPCLYTARSSHALRLTSSHPTLLYSFLHCTWPRSALCALGSASSSSGVPPLHSASLSLLPGVVSWLIPQYLRSPRTRALPWPVSCRGPPSLSRCLPGDLSPSRARSFAPSGVSFLISLPRLHDLPSAHLAGRPVAPGALSLVPPPLLSEGFSASVVFSFYVWAFSCCPPPPPLLADLASLSSFLTPVFDPPRARSLPCAWSLALVVSRPWGTLVWCRVPVSCQRWEGGTCVLPSQLELILSLVFPNHYANGLPSTAKG